MTICASSPLLKSGSSRAALSRALFNSDGHRRWLGIKRVVRAMAAIGALAAIPVHGASAEQVSSQVPPRFRGVWGKNGRCDIASNRLTITAKAAGWGNGPYKPVAYSVDDQSVSWAEEYETGNFQMGNRPKVLIENSEGNNMPEGRRIYFKCGDGKKRLPW